MTQLLILSGKGGTGKTTVAGAFIWLSQARAYADCDVDAPNLHLISHWSDPPERTDYFGMPKAGIDPAKCIGCGRCLAHCRFDAIEEGAPFLIKPFSCEGCGVCAAVCPAGAVSMEPDRAGELALFQDDAHVFSTAKLRMGSGTSGRLVTEVKKQMASAAENAELAIIDGSPGIGCPVIASISGVDLVLVVAEPSLSGISDMARILKAAEIFRVKTAVCANKADASPAKLAEIWQFCKQNSIPFIGAIPFDRQAVSAINSGRSIAEIDCPSGRAVREIYQAAMALLFDEGEKPL